MASLPQGEKLYVASEPYPWPYNGDLRPENTALMVIDMQVDFCGVGGFFQKMGYDISLTRAPIEPIKQVLAACRALGFRVFHTREGHRPDLSDLAPNKRARSERSGAPVGQVGPTGSRLLVRGEEGHDIIPELRPLPGEPVIDKPGHSAFYATDLELMLRSAGITNLVLTGVTTDVCVHMTMRAANDRGFECLLLSDCTGAGDAENHAAALSMVKMSGGIFGAVATGQQVLDAIVPKGQSATSSALASSLQPHSESQLTVPARPSPFTFAATSTALVLLGPLQHSDGSWVAELLSEAREAGVLAVQCATVAEAAGHPAGGLVLQRTGRSAFFQTGLRESLQQRGIMHLLLAGGADKAAMLATVYEANDWGYDCLVISGAEPDAAALEPLVAGAAPTAWMADQPTVLKVLAL